MARIKVNIRDINRMAQIITDLKELKSYSIKVGIFGNDEYVMIANVHEFGATIRNGKGNTIIPERSFIRSTFDENKGEWLLFFERQLKLLLNGRLDAKTLCERLGAKIVADIQKKIKEITTPPNAPNTIVQKGSSSPLIDTGGLRHRITYKVEKK